MTEDPERKKRIEKFIREVNSIIRENKKTFISGNDGSGSGLDADVVPKRKRIYKTKLSK